MIDLFSKENCILERLFDHRRRDKLIFVEEGTRQRYNWDKLKLERI